jgi:hypothetical protein
MRMPAIAGHCPLAALSSGGLTNATDDHIEDEVNGDQYRKKRTLN